MGINQDLDKMAQERIADLEAQLADAKKESQRHLTAGRDLQRTCEALAKDRDYHEALYKQEVGRAREFEKQLTAAREANKTAIRFLEWIEDSASKLTTGNVGHNGNEILGYARDAKNRTSKALAAGEG